MSDRLRRLRRTRGLRTMFQETRLRPSDLIYPIFVSEKATEPEPIESMPGQFRLPLSHVANAANQATEAGIGAILIFGLPGSKDESASESRRRDGIVQNAIRASKDAKPDLTVITDVCVCAYTPHGHCGIVRDGDVVNDESLELLAEMAVSHAEAGADMVGPSSMMDHQVYALREGLDDAGFDQTAILAYSAKFASAFYGPFRDAADSAPSHGDRASYQHDPANIRHAQRELLADVDEGADVLMVKPGLAYLDVVRLARETTDLPIAVYNVSGEYSMVKAAAERGWIDERRIVLESLLAFRRAGADLIITYHALDGAKWLNDN
ncbi:MAG: porphobilinogen synthase [Armatimonadetes bacterium]|nr:porphobilinogen synthase [Armatimonadota bacterium]